MEPWLQRGNITVKDGELILPTKSEKVLSSLAETVRNFMRTMKDDFWHDPYVAALQYYFSIVPIISAAKSAFPYYSGRSLKGRELAVSICIDPDYSMGLKEPLLRYANAMPGIAATTPDFSTSAEYSLFIFCYRTLISVLEELLLAVEKHDTRNAFAALYDVNSAFEELRLLFLKCSGKYDPPRKALPDLPPKICLERAAEHCVDALRATAREFYIIEMLLFKTQVAQKEDRRSRLNRGNGDFTISKREFDGFVKNLMSRGDNNRTAAGPVDA